MDFPMSDNDSDQGHLTAEFLLRILDALPTPIFVKGKDARFVYSNRKHNELVNLPEGEIIGKTDADLYPSQFAENYLRTDQLVLETGTISSIEEAAPMRDGQLQPVLNRKVRMIAPDGEPYVVGINFSLLEVKRREEQYRALAETVPVGVLQIEENGTVSFNNPLTRTYFAGIEQGLNVSGVSTAFGQPAGFPGKAARFECSLKDLAGEVHHVLVISSGWLKLGNNANRSSIVSIVDISENAELKRINEEILRLNRELAESMQKLRDAQDALVKKGRMEQMGQLTATIAHELRNPLGAVRTSVFLVERKIKGKNLGVEPQLQRINNGVSRCDAIITQLLDFSRTKQLECKSDDLDQWLARTCEEEARRLAGCINLSCYLGLDGAKVPFDPGRLQRAIANLISNAAEAMVGNGDLPLPGQIDEPTISVTTRIDGGHVEIEVSDNGPGMNESVIEKIREPLFTTKSFGTGLGVPAVEQIAAQHGGTLSIHSRPGEGANFVVRIPLVQVGSEEAA